MNQFKSKILVEKWADLHKKRQELIDGVVTEKVQNKIDYISSVMTTCKTGFTFPESKIRNTLIFLREHTNNNRVRYGLIPNGLKTNNVLFKNTVLIYAEHEGVVIFREYLNDKK